MPSEGPEPLTEEDEGGDTDDSRTRTRTQATPSRDRTMTASDDYGEDEFDEEEDAGKWYHRSKPHISTKSLKNKHGGLPVQCGHCK